MRDSGAKSASPRPWRAQISLGLQRGLQFDSRMGNINRAVRAPGGKRSNRLKDLFNPNISGSLADVRNLFYSLRFQANYSLKNQKSSFLKKTELFIRGAFVTPLPGYSQKTRLHEYKGFSSYMGYGLRDIAMGLTAPLYTAQSFFSEWGISLVPYPLSLFSREAGFRGRLGTNVSALYFLKKSKAWSLSLESSHAIAYSHYVKRTADSGYRDNIPFDMTHLAGLRLGQNAVNCLPGFAKPFFIKNFGAKSFKCAPSSVRVFASYYLGIDSYLARYVLDGAQSHDLGLGAAVSWRLGRALFLGAALQWKDRVSIYSPRHAEVKKSDKTRWFDWDRMVLSLSLSASF